MGKRMGLSLWCLNACKLSILWGIILARRTDDCETEVCFQDLDGLQFTTFNPFFCY